MQFNANLHGSVALHFFFRCVPVLLVWLKFVCECTNAHTVEKRNELTLVRKAQRFTFIFLPRSMNSG